MFGTEPGSGVEPVVVCGPVVHGGVVMSSEEERTLRADMTAWQYFLGMFRYQSSFLSRAAPEHSLDAVPTC